MRTISAPNTNDSGTRHNQAIDAYRANRVSGYSRNEAQIIELHDAINAYAHGPLERAEQDYLLIENVLTPLLSAFRNALNWDLGRLDAGTLDAWVLGVANDLGIDADSI